MSKPFNPKDFPKEVQQYLLSQELRIEELEKHREQLFQFCSLDYLPPYQVLYYVGAGFMHLLAYHQELHPQDHEQLRLDLVEIYRRLYTVLASRQELKEKS